MYFCTFVLFCSLMLVMSTVFSASVPVLTSDSNKYFNSFYVGFGGGINYAKARFKSITHATALDPSSIEVGEDFFDNFNNSLSGSLHKYRPIGRFFLGYGHEISQRLYLGIEAGAVFSKVEMQAQHVTDAKLNFGGVNPLSINGNVKTSTNLHQSTFIFDADIKIGYLSSPHTLIFGLVGVAINRIKFNSQSQFHYSVISSGEEFGTGGASFSLTRAKTDAGLRFGAGIEHFVTENLTIGLTYTYTFYNNLHVNGSTSTDGMYFAAGTNWHIENGLRNHANAISVHNQAVMANLTYYFHQVV